MIKILDNMNCCGCSACYSICPHDAIDMLCDEQGFLYPKVREKDCVQCGLCNKICPYENFNRPHKDLEKTFVGIYLNETIRSRSSSGGLFAVLAERILDRNGVVFGAAYDSEWMAFHKPIERKSDIPDLIGSKYMQSRMGDCFKHVKSLLQTGKEVLFVGTTCQINGLKNYLIYDYTNLLTVDFICLGVPSPMIWSDYLDTFFQKENIRNINFKDKSLGWHTFSLRIDENNRTFCKNGRETYYFNGYFRHLYTRPSCANCVAKRGNRMSDITISDCWGYNVIAPEMDDNKGMSSIVCHSEKGLRLFEECKDSLKWKEGCIEDIIQYNSGYRESAPDGENKSAFWNDYKKLDKKKLFIKYCSPIKNDIVSKVARKIGKMIRKVCGGKR